ncbi:hypothetical protein BGZ70_004959 [Mortierella alpina]|uniref:RING-type E3 ubiquitin transferase n=1 Tax=Mortierella alpina TaxID=64518 RepID=A0A9P6JEE9_MORAP|nr:hypothetical protein BGZ70_004959 [Mortierella alpina]
MEEEEEICRVCRYEGSPDQPLFHPCKCSGSIRFVHQDCLVEWLERSNKKYCELCKHTFEFTLVYSPEMPDILPAWMLARRAADILAVGVRVLLRALLVATIWLVLLPYATVWIWRLYFWVGDWFAFSANGLAVPMPTPANSTAVSRNDTEILQSYEQMDSLTRFVQRTISPEYSWLSKFVLDCFDGHVISAVVVVVFVAVFLLREWVLQNQDPEAEEVEMHEQQNEDLQAFIDRLREENWREHEDAIRDTHGAAGAGEAVRDDAQDFDIAMRRNLHAFVPRHLRENVAPNLENFWDDLENNAVGNERQPASLQEPNRLSTQEVIPRADNAPSLGLESQPNYLDSQWTQGSPSSTAAATPSPNNGPAHLLGLDDNGEGSSSGRIAWSTSSDHIRTKSQETLYWREGIPLTYSNVFLRSDGSSMTLDERIERYEELCQTGNLSLIDSMRLLEWRADQAEAQMHQITLRPEMTVEERMQSVQRLDHSTMIMEQQRDMLLRQSADHIQPRAHNVPVEPAHGPAAPPRPLPALAPRPPRPMPVAPAVAPPPPPPPQRQQQPAADVNAGDAVNDAEDIDIPEDLEELNVEDLDGILQVIGMRGSYWLLLQNSLLMTALICASLGLGVMIPYILGKTALLMNPLNVLLIPLRILSSITDPITDFVIDRIIPWMAVVVVRPITLLSRFISPYLPSELRSYFGGETLRPLGNLIKSRVSSFWSIIVGEIRTSIPARVRDTAEVAGTAEQPSIADTSVSAAATLIQQYAAKWSSLAYGSSSNDKVLATLFGYAILFAAGSWFMKRKHVNRGHSVGRLVHDILRQLGLIMKIAFFVAIEMVAFPLFCGVVVGTTTLPMLPGATLASRWAFYLRSPNWAVVMHWLLGTAFMYNFSLFVSVSRTVVRPGVMWFIRDPNDEGFHPVREIMERPVLVQLRKLSTGVLMYLTLILLSASLDVQGVSLILKGILPLRWRIDEPLSDVPFDMLIFHLLVPFTLHWIDPSERFKAIFENWWRWLAKTMRLSSFMYGKNGERFPDEEGHIVYRTWTAWLLRYQPPIPGVERSDNNAVGSGEELDIEAPAIFVRDGGLYRVPSTDRVVHLKGRRVLVPVDEQGRALDPKEDLPGEIDPLMEIQPRGREPQPLIDPKKATVVVYAPPNFKRRLISFIAIIWTSTTAFLTMSVVTPLLIGRCLISLATARQVHDIYSFVVGVYTISSLWHLEEWAFSVYRAHAPQNVVGSVDFKAYFRTAWRYGKLVTKGLYFALVFGLLFPLALGLMMELFLIIPLRAAVGDETGVIPTLSWAVGLLYMKIIHWTLVAFPDNRVTVDMNRVFVGTDVAEWDVLLATRRLVLPAAGICLLSIGCPAASAWAVARALGLEGDTRLKFFRLMYPVGFLVGLVVFGFMESVPVFKGWSDYVRDQEYLVGRRLHNLAEENESSPGNQESTSSSASISDEEGQSTGSSDQEGEVLTEKAIEPVRPQEGYWDASRWPTNWGEQSYGGG